ncbi:MAG: transcription elongation factor GreA [Gracilibacteraceae bacterium]|jgi:transcription elongation factor GreA|nr:transcription elongation factor GreA [Gracilibacteraceae bacterium]
MSGKEVILTVAGLQKLEEELELLKTQRRKEVAGRLKQAIEFGDISENSEYEDAKNEQAFIEGRIIMLEDMLRNAKVIDDNDDSDVVTLGSTVLLRDMENSVEETYMIVGSAEADPMSNKISNESPVGKAVLGQSKGGAVEVMTPGGALSYQIVDIS